MASAKLKPAQLALLRSYAEYGHTGISPYIACTRIALRYSAPRNETLLSLRLIEPTGEGRCRITELGGAAVAAGKPVPAA